jgi:3-(3-hydroxy-phenyl)propionate hydroxylase
MERAVSMVTDVLVVGFGPVGATIANLLGRYGVRALVVDKATEIFQAPRAIALDNEALRILQLAGLGEGAFETIAIPMVRLRSPYLGVFGCLNTLGAIDGHPKLVTFFQPELERALRAGLANYPGVHTLLGVELTGIVETGEGVEAALTRADGGRVTVQARYLIGADGAGSTVRQLIGQGFAGRSFAEDWLIVDALNVPRPIDHVEFICDHRRPTPHMVAPGGRERWEFMLKPGETRQDMERDDKIAALLAPWGRPDEMQVERRAVYRFHARVVDCFQKGRVFLAGDAAHITPPFAGQGLVAGLRDAANLCWKLAWVLKGRATPAILASYDVERRPHAKAMIKLARFMGRQVMPTNAAAAFLTHGLMRLLRAVPPLRRYFEDLGIKPKNRFGRGLFVRGPSRLIRGGLLPQGWLRGVSGDIQLSDDVLGPGLCLVGFGLDPRGHLSPATLQALVAAGGEVVQICHRGQRLHRAAQAPGWEDLANAFLPAVPFGWVALVRPDRTILHDGPMAAADRIVHEGLGVLGPGIPVAAPAPALAS